MFRLPLTLLLAIASQCALAVDPVVEKRIGKALNELAPDTTIDSIAEAAIAGFYEVATGDGEIVHVSADGKYLFMGALWDLKTRRDLTAVRKAEMRKNLLDAVGQDRRISFNAKNEKYRIVVFTDIDCRYCRQLHQQMAAYNNHGISIDYLFFPSSGPDTESFTKGVSVWCAKDRAEALTRAKAGEEIEAKTCENPITEEYELGMKIGIIGTPMIIAEDGNELGGYVRPGELIRRLETRS